MKNPPPNQPGLPFDSHQTRAERLMPPSEKRAGRRREFHDATPLGEVRDWLEEGVQRPPGAICPVCQRHSQIYVRPINSGMALSLIRMYRVSPFGWIHLPTSIPAVSREEAKLRYWGLVSESDERRRDGGRKGWWRVTAAGRAFIQGGTVPKFARLYNRELLNLEGPPVTLRECLDQPFDLAKLMAGEDA